MKPSAVLLIDLENFYCSREDYCRDGPPPGYDRVRFAYDLEKLLSFARSMADGLPFTVRRAYANFNAARYPGGAPPQYYLRQLPDELMRQGVEPVQVFRLSQSSSKNAADMRMAMDATALLKGVGSVEHFVLVTGDADFIPVILELKRHGHTVSVIGVTGATNALIQRFVDNFELFEDLLAAEEVEARSGDLAQTGDRLAHAVEAVRKLLSRNHPLRFAAVKPLLSKELGHAFDPGLFGCDTTGEFLRKYQHELGVVIRPTQHDQEIDLPDSVPSSNGATGSKAVTRPVARQPDRAKSTDTPPEPHSREHYLQLLTSRGQAQSATGSIRVPAVPWPALVWGCDAMVNLLAPPGGSATHTTSLQPKLLKAAEGVSIPDIVKHLRALYPILRAGLPVQGTDGVYSLPAGTTGEQIRRSVLNYIGYVLNCRLTENHVAGTIRPESLAAVFDHGPALESTTAEVVAALAEPTPVPPQPVASPHKTPPYAEELHTPSGYARLLKAGGAKGSETESFKILPVPWPSVERVCADVFPILCPVKGATGVPREQLYARLGEAGKDLCIERYEQHVRRALGILRVAGDLTEERGLVALNPDVASGLDLRNRALAFLLQLLQLRLEERAIYDPICPEAFVAALEAGSLTDRLMEEVPAVIAWLYRPPDGEAGPVEAELELIPEDEAEELPLPTGDDSRVVAIEGETEIARLPSDQATDAVDPSATASEPSADSFAFDDAFPEIGQPEPRPVERDESEAPVEAVIDTTPEDTLSPGSDVIDVAAITRQAVAAAVGEIQAKKGGDPSDSPVTSDGAAGTAVPPPGSKHTVPVGDWLPDGSPRGPDVALTNQHIPAAPVTPKMLHASQPVPAPPAMPLAKITPPPLPPCPPPESA